MNAQPQTVESLITTIIPVYNRPGQLREAVESVLAQTYRPIEIIIVDDGSTDDTAVAAKALQTAHPDLIESIRLERNSGPGPAREAGRLCAKGEFVQYLDSDDLLRPTKFDVQAAALRAHPECGVAYGYICYHPAAQPSQQEPYRWSGRTIPSLFPGLLIYRWWDSNCPLYRRSVLNKVGPWSDLRWSQDWEYDGRVGALGTKLVHCREWVCDERQTAGLTQSAPADWCEPDRASNRARLIKLLYGYARRAGVTCADIEMRHFARWAFHISRRCGAAGLVNTSEECFELAREASAPERRNGNDFRLYRAMTSILGWKFTGKVFCKLLDGGKGWHPGKDTISFGGQELQR